MFLEILLAIALGVASGIFTGLIPGIHANTIAVLLLIAPIEKNLYFALLITSMSITHSIVDNIPSILLGAPSQETSINLLPGHELLLKGRGLEAIRTSVLGSLIAAITSTMILPISFSASTVLQKNLPIIIPAAITITIILMIAWEKNKKHAIITLLFSGIIGVITLNIGVKEPVFTLIIGFFAIPSLVQTILFNTKIPKQKKPKNKSVNINQGIIGALTAGLLSMFPAIGPSQAAVIVKTISGKITKKGYLMLTGGINTANLVFSILMLFSLEKTRTGMAVALNSIPKIDSTLFPTLIFSCLFATGLAVIITDYLAEKTITKITRINYVKTSKAILLMLIGMVLIVSGPLGLIACTSAFGTAFFGLKSNVKRSNLMGFLLLPTLIIYLT